MTKEIWEYIGSNIWKTGNYKKGYKYNILDKTLQEQILTTERISIVESLNSVAELICDDADNGDIDKAQIIILNLIKELKEKI